jgi:hypothetical protein
MHILAISAAISPPPPSGIVIAHSVQQLQVSFVQYPDDRNSELKFHSTVERSNTGPAVNLRASARREGAQHLSTVTELLHTVKQCVHASALLSLLPVWKSFTSVSLQGLVIQTLVPLCFESGHKRGDSVAPRLAHVTNPGIHRLLLQNLAMESVTSSKSTSEL